MAGSKTFCRSITIAALVCVTGAALNDGAAIKLQLNHDLSEGSVSSACLNGDAFRFHDAAIVLREGGTNGTISDVPVTWDAEAKTFTTSGGELIRIDPTATPSPTFTMNKGSTRCVYDMTVLAGGEFMGITGSGTITERGLWQFAELVKEITTATRCATFAPKDRAYVAYSTPSTSAKGVVFGSWEGYVETPSRLANLTAHSKPDPWLYLSVDGSTGTVHFSTHSDGKGRIWGCVYRIVVTEGSVMGITPSSLSSPSPSNTTSSSSTASSRVSGDGGNRGDGSSKRRLRRAVAQAPRD